MNTKDLKFSKSKTILFLVAILFASTTLFLGCDEEINSLGSEIMPDGDKIHVLYDSTLTIKSLIVQDEPFNTSNLDYYTIGAIDDPYFGKFSGSLLTEYTPDSLKMENMQLFNVDSIVLYLEIDSAMGEYENLSWNVYELIKSIDSDSSYLSDSDINEFYNEITLVSESCDVMGDSLIRFKLRDSYARKLISDDQYYTSDSAFKARFKGLLIHPTSSGQPGGTATINLNSGNTNISFYYNTIDSDSLILNYYFKNGEKFSNYSFDYSNSLIETLLTNNESDPDGFAILQGMNGLSSTISINNISRFIESDSTYSILDANLTLPIVNEEYSDLFNPPHQIASYFQTEDSLKYEIEDYYQFLTKTNYNYDGYLNSQEKFYHFDISRHLMNIINGEVEDSCIYLTIVNNTRYPSRVILKTGEDINLKITYTKHKP